jgi:hypothetical protein
LTRKGLLTEIRILMGILIRKEKLLMGKMEMHIKKDKSRTGSNLILSAPFMAGTLGINVLTIPAAKIINRKELMVVNRHLEVEDEAVGGIPLQAEEMEAVVMVMAKVLGNIHSKQQNRQRSQRKLLTFQVSRETRNNTTLNEIGKDST